MKLVCNYCWSFPLYDYHDFVGVSFKFFLFQMWCNSGVFLDRISVSFIIPLVRVLDKILTLTPKPERLEWPKKYL